MRGGIFCLPPLADHAFTATHRGMLANVVPEYADCLVWLDERDYAETNSF